MSGLLILHPSFVGSVSIFLSLIPNGHIEQYCSPSFCLNFILFSYSEYLSPYGSTIVSFFSFSFSFSFSLSSSFSFSLSLSFSFSSSFSFSRFGSKKSIYEKFELFDKFEDCNVRFGNNSNLSLSISK